MSIVKHHRLAARVLAVFVMSAVVALWCASVAFAAQDDRATQPLAAAQAGDASSASAGSQVYVATGELNRGGAGSTVETQATTSSARKATARPLLDTRAAKAPAAKAKSAKKSSYGLIAKNGRLYPCNAKGQKIADNFKPTSTITKIFVAANASKVPSNPKYGFTYKGVRPVNPVRANVKSFVFMSKKGKSAVKSVAAHAMEYSSLTSIVGLEKTRITTIGDEAFAKSKVKSIKLPKTVKSIGKLAFANCSSLKSLPGFANTRVTAIPDSAFQNCTSLASIALPSNLRTIQAYAFYNCAALRSISLPMAVATIKSGAFYGCANLTSVQMPSAAMVTGDTATSSMTGVFLSTPISDDNNFDSCIYVPATLLPAYQQADATNPWWYYRLKFRAL